MTSIPAHHQRPDPVPREPAAPPRLELSGTQVLASGLASVSAAVVASAFGVAGTVVGAAVVGVVWTLGSAFYRYWIGRTQRRLQQAGPTIRRTWPGRPATGARDTGHADRATAVGAPGAPGAPPLPATEEHHGDGPARAGWRARLSRRRVGVAAGVVIVLAFSLAVVTLVEIVAREPLAGLTGGEPSGRTSIGSLLDGGDDDPDAPDGTTTTITTAPGAPAPTSEPGAPTPAPTTGDTAPADTTTTEEQSTTETSTTLAPEVAPDDGGQ